MRLLKHVIQHFSSLKPNIKVKQISDIDFKKLHSIGVRYVVFDRDNTITKHHFKTYIETRNDRSTVHYCQQLFGESRVALLSNGLIGYKNESQLDLPIIYTREKKPFNDAAIRLHFPHMVLGQELCIVGDRLFTDCLLANKMGAVSILVDPIDPSLEGIGIRIMRTLEKIYLATQRKKTQPHKYYGRFE